jgi:hypothetical protein
VRLIAALGGTAPPLAARERQRTFRLSTAAAKWNPVKSGLGVSDADTSAHHAFRIGFSLLLGALAFWPENRELLKPIIA